MIQSETRKPAPWHMWLIGIPLLLFNSLAALDYTMTIARYQPYLANHPEDALAYFYAAPLWMFLMWGLSMVGGFLGTVLLLMCRRAAVPVFAIAWVGSVVAVAYTVINPPPIGPGNLASAVIIIISFLILVYFYWLRRRGVLR